MQLISIIMPYYKKIAYVELAINSVLNQTYKNFELLIVYDDPELYDLNKLKQIVKDNKKIRIIQNSKNLGAGYSRNIGIKNSRGEVISFIDSDDEWHPQKIEKQLNFLNKNNYDFIFCSYEKKIDKKIIPIKCKNKYLNYKNLLFSCDIGLSTVMLNKDIVDANLFPNLKTQEDFAAWLKITKKKILAYNLEENLVTWNYTNNSLSSNFFQKIIDAFKVYKNYENFSNIKSLFFLTILSINSIKRKF
jgi:teichuronic acid biosynthesis glycosyltransferase TuaG